MKTFKGDFNYNTNKNPMGSLTDSILDLAISQAGKAIETDPAQKQRAMEMITTTVSNGIKEGVAENKGLIITGLFIFGLSMAVANVVLFKVSEASLGRK